MQRSHECSESGVAALLWIHRAPGLRNEELSELLGMSESTVVRLVSRLVGRGLVQREADPRDGRAIRLRTSELGARRALGAMISRGEVTRSLVEGLPGVLIPRLVRIAERLLTAMANEPWTGLRICRFCHWAACRNDETAPCPVVLATTTPPCRSGPVRQRRVLTAGAFTRSAGSSTGRTRRSGCDSSPVGLRSAFLQASDSRTRASSLRTAGFDHPSRDVIAATTPAPRAGTPRTPRRTDAGASAPRTAGRRSPPRPRRPPRTPGDLGCPSSSA